MDTIRSRSILFVTGAFVHNSCWDDWQRFFQGHGYTTKAPAWPYKQAPSAKVLRDLRPNDMDLAELTLERLIQHYVKAAASFPEKPIVIGHSLGGLITQILVNRDLAAAGVAIHPVPPQGVIPYEFSFIRGGWKALGLFTSLKKTYLMSFRDWQYAFVNGMPLDEQRAAYERYAIPESKTVARGGLTSAAKVDLDKPHAPLLIMSGGTDTIIPAHLNLRNYKAYKKNGSVLAYKEMPGRNHFVLGQPTWQEDAAFVQNWIAGRSDRMEVSPLAHGMAR